MSQTASRNVAYMVLLLGVNEMITDEGNLKEDWQLKPALEKIFEGMSDERVPFRRFTGSFAYAKGLWTKNVGTPLKGLPSALRTLPVHVDGTLRLRLSELPPQTQEAFVAAGVFEDSERAIVLGCEHACRPPRQEVAPPTTAANFEQAGSDLAGVETWTDEDMLVQLLQRYEALEKENQRLVAENAALRRRVQFISPEVRARVEEILSPQAHRTGQG